MSSWYPQVRSYNLGAPTRKSSINSSACGREGLCGSSPGAAKLTYVWETSAERAPGTSVWWYQCPKTDCIDAGSQSNIRQSLWSSEYAQDTTWSATGILPKSVEVVNNAWPQKGYSSGSMVKIMTELEFYVRSVPPLRHTESLHWRAFPSCSASSCIHYLAMRTIKCMQSC